LTRITLRLDFPNGERLGPGKVLLLEQIRATGSISAAGRSVGMSYRRAWQLADSLNRTFREPVVVTRLGGERGGGAGLTPFGEHLLEAYRTMEALTRDVVAAPLALLEQDLAEGG
jgi:molybdate transport system regulatory protein